VLTVFLAWLAATAVCAAAVVFGQVARTAPRRRRRRRAARIGLFLSLSGPWLTFAGAVAAGAATGAWLQAAAGGALAVTVVALVGLGLAPR
jgi:hypothetical protein